MIWIGASHEVEHVVGVGGPSPPVLEGSRLLEHRDAPSGGVEGLMFPPAPAFAQAEAGLTRSGT
jgi:hypothetical protein